MTSEIERNKRLCFVCPICDKTVIVDYTKDDNKFDIIESCTCINKDNKLSLNDWWYNIMTKEVWDKIKFIDVNKFNEVMYR